MKNIIVRENDALVDELEFALLHYPPAHTEIKSVFTKGYVEGMGGAHERTDPDLVAAVEALGEEANGLRASLLVVEIPDDVDWYIEEYDGHEWIAETHRTWP